MQNVTDAEENLRLALAGFLGAMQSEDAAMRAKAIGLFRTAATPETQERLLGMLVEALDSGVGARSEAASETLTAIGMAAMMPLTMRFLHARKPARRRQAVELLGAICARHGLPPGYALGLAVEDRDPDVRKAAEEAWRALREAYDERAARLESAARDRAVAGSASEGARRRAARAARPARGRPAG